MIELKSWDKRIKAETYRRRELIDIIEGKIELIQFDKNPRISRMNQLAGIIEMVLYLDEHDNSNNLENGNLVILYLHIM